MIRGFTPDSDDEILVLPRLFGVRLPLAPLKSSQNKCRE